MLLLKQPPNIVTTDVIDVSEYIVVWEMENESKTFGALCLTSFLWTVKRLFK